MKKNKKYNECFKWIESKINDFGPQNISDLMWNNMDTTRELVSYIINYDDHFVFDQNNNVCLSNDYKSLSAEAKPYSYGALKT